jgi:4-alpha-glucanotransferase
MSGTGLAGLAEAAGVAPCWRDVHGAWHDVSPDTLQTVLGALGLPAETGASVRDSLAELRRAAASLPPMVTAQAGQATRIAARPGRYELHLEDGSVQDGMLAAAEGGAELPALVTPGYHRLTADGQQVAVAVAPPRCFTVQDAAPGRRLWALAVQLYALCRAGDGGLGDFGALQDLVCPAAKRGAAAIAISPIHAQFSADPDRFGPYSPSSRIGLNVLHTRLDMPGTTGGDLVDWPSAGRARLAALRALFEAADAATLDQLAAYRTREGDALETHARFEALHAHLFGADPGRWHWRTWPEQYRNPANPAVAAFARDHAEAVRLHAFMQFMADRSLGGAQRAARDAGMPIGLIADLAVGADSGGSHCWSRQAETLLGLSIGAPPDLLSISGQNWGLAAFNPRGLVQNGFGAYLELLRSAMRHAGGVRIDHALGLARLWVVPDGASAADGAYVAFPTTDLLRLIALESSRHQAVVLGEDLGTIPDGFQERLQDAGILGMRVLWFERDKQDRFTSPRTWSVGAAAMTSTHDLATVAGWWQGRDLEWRGKLDLLGDAANAAQERDARTRDRGLLWDAMRDSGAAQGDAPADWDAHPVVDAAARHVGGSACDFVILPIEDALGLQEQPNLPGTLDQHPNWRRRLPGMARDLLQPADVAARLDGLNQARTTA